MIHFSPCLFQTLLDLRLISVAISIKVKPLFQHYLGQIMTKDETPVECVGCNTFDVGSILDNSEVTAHFERVYANQAEAEQALAKLTQKARDTETEPCEIKSEFQSVDSSVLLKASFTFSCQAEVLIFQLGTRSF